ncbi:aspartyl-phosphate phosphatase Spo0E family protein [Niallia circulans]|uniref:Spo0E family sporulation regulatory protein-aspartic acid phosphatase n=1 Tax=Bacillaceae TaxID=186817 RepID=UPI0039797B59
MDVLKRKIEQKRKEMYEKADKHGITSNEVLKISQELDILINEKLRSSLIERKRVISSIEDLKEKEIDVLNGKYEVTKEVAHSIVKTFKPLGKFYMNDNGVYIGIDNSTGACWTEEFKNKNDCLNWL